MAKQGLLFCLNKPLVRDSTARLSLQQWYRHKHLRDLFGLDQSQQKKIWLYQPSDASYTDGPARFLTLFPTVTVISLETSRLRTAFDPERRILDRTSPYRDVPPTASISSFFQLPTERPRERNIEVHKGPWTYHLLLDEGDPLPGGHEDPPPEREFNHFSHTQDYRDCMDYTTPDGYDPAQNSWACYEDPASYAETSKTEMFEGPLPADGIRLYEAMDMQPRAYQKIASHDGVRTTPTLASNPKVLNIPEATNSILLITQIPHVPSLSMAENDTAFLVHFGRYPTLTIVPEFRGMVAYQQNDPRYPRWLVIQEYYDGLENFGTTEIDAGWVEMKKMEVRAWWKRQGAPGAVPEFWRLAQAYIEGADET